MMSDKKRCRFCRTLMLSEWREDACPICQAAEDQARVERNRVRDVNADRIGQLEAEIERLRALLEGYEAMEKTMKREVSQ